MKTLRFLLAGLLLAACSALAQTAKNRSSLYSDIDVHLPDNTSGAITPAVLRAQFKDVVASAFNTINADAQPVNANLTAISGLTTQSFGLNALTYANAAAARSAYGLIIGTDVQAFSANLTGWAGVAPAGYLTNATASSTYAPLSSPALSGTPTAPTATNGTNTTQLATTAFVLANAGTTGSNSDFTFTEASASTSQDVGFAPASGKAIVTFNGVVQSSGYSFSGSVMTYTAPANGTVIHVFGSAPAGGGGSGGTITGITAGTGLTGGGSSGAVTVSASVGTTTGTLAAGDDARFPSTTQKSALAGTSGTPGSGNAYVTDGDSRNTNSRAPSGSAGGDLTGTYPNPTLGSIGSATGPVGDSTHVAAVTIDAKGRVTGLSPVAISGGGGGTPGGSTTQIQYNNSGAFGGTAELTYASGVFTYTKAAVGNAVTPGIKLVNTTAATSGPTDQSSPSLTLTGFQWDGFDSASHAVSSNFRTVGDPENSAFRGNYAQVARAGGTRGPYLGQDFDGVEQIYAAKFKFLSPSSGAFAGGNYIIEYRPSFGLNIGSSFDGMTLQTDGAARVTIFDASTTVSNPLVLQSDLQINGTMTAGGTTGAQTINKSTGRVNFAAAASTLVVTNSLVASSSKVFVQVCGVDTTAKTATVTKSAGAFTITLNAAATAETEVDFLVIN